MLRKFIAPDDLVLSLFVRKMVATHFCAKSWSFWILNFPALLYKLGCRQGIVLPLHMVLSPICQQSYAFP